MPFWVSSADAAGVRIAGFDELLSPGPSAIETPVEPAGRFVETSGGVVVKQQPSKDPRRRAWVWERLPSYRESWITHIQRLESLLATTRRARGLSPWVFLKDDVTDEFRIQRFVSGSATGVTSSTLTDTSKSLVVNVAKYGTIEIVSGTGAGQRRSITANTATQFTVTPNWTTNPTSAAYSVQYNEAAWIRVRVLAVSKQPVPRSGLSWEAIRLEFVVDDVNFNALG